MKTSFSDFHGAWQNHTGLNAPLYRRFDETDTDAMLNQVQSNIRSFSLNIFFKDFGISIWLKNGAPAHKLVLGIPLFGSNVFISTNGSE